MEPEAGLFVAFEGIDGSGKSTLTQLVMRLLQDRGFAVRAATRADRSGPEPYRSLVDGVGRVFAGADEFAVPFHILGLAAAAQHVAMIEQQVRAHVAAGGIVLAESWWWKTWARLVLDAQRCLGHTELESERFAAWLEAVFDYPPALPLRQVTVFVDTDAADRVRWYRAAPIRQTFYDVAGDLSSDPVGFGAYTEQAQQLLRSRAQQDGWGIVHNAQDRSLQELAEEVAAVIAAHSAQPPPTTDRYAWSDRRAAIPSLG